MPSPVPKSIIYASDGQLMTVELAIVIIKEWDHKNNSVYFEERKDTVATPDFDLNKPSDDIIIDGNVTLDYLKAMVFLSENT